MIINSSESVLNHFLMNSKELERKKCSNLLSLNLAVQKKLALIVKKSSTCPMVFTVDEKNRLTDNMVCLDCCAKSNDLQN